MNSDLLEIIKKEGVSIREHSPFAKIARWNMKYANVAMVLGKTIHLSGVTKEEFLKDRAWVKHELVHVAQFKQFGYWRFLWMYLIESVKVGYYENKFEREAREGAK